MDQVVTILSFLVLASVAAERLTEIIKLAFLKRFNVNAAVYQLMAGLFGAWLAYLVPSPLNELIKHEWAVIAITGLCVSGGSGLWNALLDTIVGYSKNVKALSASERS